MKKRHLPVAMAMVEISKIMTSAGWQQAGNGFFKDNKSVLWFGTGGVFGLQINIDGAASHCVEVYGRWIRPMEHFVCDDPARKAAGESTMAWVGGVFATALGHVPASIYEEAGQFGDIADAALERLTLDHGHSLGIAA